MTLAGLGTWLERRLQVGDLDLDEGVRPSLNGMSNDTLVVGARWSEGGERREGSFVVRRAPEGPSVYMSYDLEAQYLTMEALQGQAVPVPPLVGFERDPAVLGRPFYVMHAVAGMAPPDVPPFTMQGWVLDLSESDQRRLAEASIEMLGQIPRLPVDELPLGHLPTGFDQLLGNTEAWLRWASDGRSYPVLEATLDWLVDNRPALAGAVSLNWGDARPGNMLYRGLRPVCVLDWEMASVGPAELDLGWWLLLHRHHTEGIGFPNLPGFPSRDETIDIWQRAAGREASDVFYHEVFAGLRFGIVVMRDCRRALEQGRELPAWNNDGDNTVTRLLTRMLPLRPDP